MTAEGQRLGSEHFGDRQATIEPIEPVDFCEHAEGIATLRHFEQPERPPLLALQQENARAAILLLERNHDPVRECLEYRFGQTVGDYELLCRHGHSPDG